MNVQNFRYITDSNNKIFCEIFATQIIIEAIDIRSLTDKIIKRINFADCGIP